MCLTVRMFLRSKHLDDYNTEQGGKQWKSVSTGLVSLFPPQPGDDLKRVEQVLQLPVRICLGSIFRGGAQSHIKWLLLIWVRSPCINRTLRDVPSHSPRTGDPWGQGRISIRDLARELQTNQLGVPWNHAPKAHLSPTHLPGFRQSRLISLLCNEVFVCLFTLQLVEEFCFPAQLGQNWI